MKDIKKLLSQKENRRLEFKREFPSNEKLMKTAIAFSNSQGGDLVTGVEDDGRVVGIDEDSVVKFEEIISNTIYDNCIPNIMPETTLVVEDSSSLFTQIRLEKKSQDTATPKTTSIATPKTTKKMVYWRE